MAKRSRGSAKLGANPNYMTRKRKAVRRPRHEPEAQGGSLRLALVIAVLVGINLYVFLWRGGTSIPAVMEKAAVAGNDSGALVDAESEGSRPGQNAPAPASEQTSDREVAGEVKPGDSMGQILRREGMSAGEADELIRALGGILDFRKLRAGQKFVLHFDGSGKLTKFEFSLSKVIKIRAKRGEDGKLVAEKLSASTELREESLGGEIEGSLFRSIRRAGEDTKLVSFFVDVFAYDLNFYVDTHPGDTYRMIVEKEYVAGDFLRYKRVIAAEYTGKRGTFRAFWWQVPGQSVGKYYDEQGRALEKTLLRTPLKFARVSSKFNPKRMHPVLHVQKGHWGTDYAAPPGTPIWSAAPGKIVFRGPRGGAGNCVIVKHDNGLQTTYMHMRNFRKGQKKGDIVRAKEVIGYVGSTGLATGPHLHFGVKKNGHYIDPQKLKMSRGVAIPRKHKKRFQLETAPLIAALAQVPAEPAPANPFVMNFDAI